MTDDEKKALMTRLENWAREYDKISGKAAAVANMVTDIRSAITIIQEGLGV